MQIEPFEMKIAIKKNKWQLIAVFSLISWSSIAVSQEAITDLALRGAWISGKSTAKETFTFSANNEFKVVTLYTAAKKDGKEVKPVTYLSEGAYKLQNGACHVGTTVGNLWMVSNSSRCCFNSYLMGRTLVFDEVRGSGFTMPLCESRTFKRESELSTKR